MDQVNDAVNENLHSAIKYSLESVIIEQPANPIEFVAQKLKEYNSTMKIECENPLNQFEVTEVELEKIRDQESCGRRDAVSSSSISAVEAADVYKTIEEELHIQEILKTIPLLAVLDGEILEALSKVMEEKVIDAGEFLITEGNPSDSFFIMLSGSSVRLEKSEEVRTYHENDTFGELFLFHYSISDFSVKATEKISVWVLTRTIFQRMIYDETLKKQERYMDYLKQFSDLENFTDTQKVRLLDSVEVKDVQAHEIVFDESMGTENISYIIDKGEYEINDSKSTLLKQGDVMGAFGWSGTITSITPGRLILLNHLKAKLLL